MEGSARAAVLLQYQARDRACPAMIDERDDRRVATLATPATSAGRTTMAARSIVALLLMVLAVGSAPVARGWQRGRATW